MNLWALAIDALAMGVYSLIHKHGGVEAWCEAMAEERWKAACNGMRLEFARLTWLGRRANRLGWIDSSVLADTTSGRPKNRLHCCGRWSGARTPVVLAVGTGGWSVVRVARGVWDVTMNVPIDVTERLVFVKSRNRRAISNVVPYGDDDAVFRVKNERGDGVAMDSAIDFLVIRFGDADAWDETGLVGRQGAAHNRGRLDAARMDWLGRRANGLGWIDSSVLAEARRRA